jgi:hypothetical protein
MIPTMHFVKAVLIAMLISFGILVSGNPKQEKPNQKVSDTAIELMPSVFDSLGQ